MQSRDANTAKRRELPELAEKGLAAVGILRSMKRGLTAEEGGRLSRWRKELLPGNLRRPRQGSEGRSRTRTQAFWLPVQGVNSSC